MRQLQYIKRLVVLVFVIGVTSHPITPYGSRLINFLGGSLGVGAAVGCGNYCDDGRHHHSQKNIGTGSDSSLVEISFQPLRELESVSSLTSLNPFVGKQFFDQDPPVPLAPSSMAAASSLSPLLNFFSSAQINNKKHFHRQRLRSNRHRPLLNDDDFQSYQQRYPDETTSSNEEHLLAAFAPIVDGPLNGIPYPAAEEVEETEDPFGFMHDALQKSIVDARGRDITQVERDKLNLMQEDVFTRQDVFTRKPQSFSKGLMQRINHMDSDANNKRNALVAYKRQKFKSHHTQFIPSISGGTMASLGDFFKNLKNNINFMEKSRLANSEEILMEGDHPIHMLKEELNSDNSKPTGTAAFLHAIRTYRPSQRIRSLVSLNPEGYHGSQFLDPNYMWVGLGKR